MGLECEIREKDENKKWTILVRSCLSIYVIFLTVDEQMPSFPVLSVLAPDTPHVINDWPCLEQLYLRVSGEDCGIAPLARWWPRQS